MSQRNYQPESPERVASALAFVDPSDRETWVKMAMATKAALGDLGFDIWNSWSEGSDSYSQSDARDVWRSAKETGGTGAATLFWHARNNGWKDDGSFQAPPALTAEQVAEREAQRAHKAAEDAARRTAAANLAKTLRDAGSKEISDHPYIKRKGAGLKYGAGIRRGSFPQRGWDDALLVPIYGADREVMSLEAISEDGEKIGLKDGARSGGFYPVGQFMAAETNPSRIVIIAEGLATAAACQAATGYPAVVAFSVGNLRGAGETVKRMCPDARLVVAADLGAELKARAAAVALGACLVVPQGDGLEKGNDFWDARNVLGGKLVAAQFEEAIAAGPLEAELPAHMTEELPAAVAAAEEVQWEPMDEADTALASKVMGTLRVHQEQLPVAAGDEDDGPVYDPKNPMPTARDMVVRLWTRSGERALQSYQGEFMEWSGAHYEEASKGDIEARCWVHLEGASCWVKNPSRESFEDAEKIRDGFKPDQAKVSNVLGALRAVTNVPASTTMPGWLSPSAELPPAEEMVSCLNGLFHLQTDRLIPHTPNFFCSNSLPFDYDADAAAPAEWLKFLQSTFGDDQEAIDALQLMFGYLLTHDTSLQKIFLLIGPPRCGKGTILRTIEQMLGKRNICAPELNNLHQTFALEEFVGKQAALVGDIRISSKADQAFIAARLLTISGGDNVSVDRKHKKAWIGKLTTRFVMCSNMTPSFSDSSGAMASRFVIFKMKNSFLNKEDLGLGQRLEAEMPAILKWAVEGWRKLQVVGRITSPASAQETVEELDDLASPVRKFIREECQVGPQDTFRVPTSDLYEAWRRWCADNGREHPGTEASFGRDLSGALHGQVKRGRARNPGASRGDKNDRTPTYFGIKLNNDTPFDY